MVFYLDITEKMQRSQWDRNQPSPTVVFFSSHRLGGRVGHVRSVVSPVGCALDLEVGNRGHDDGDAAVDDRRLGGALQMAVVSSVGGDGISGLSVFDDVHAHDLRLTIDAQQAEAIQQAEHDAAETHRPKSDDEETRDIHACRLARSSGGEKSHE